MHRDRQHRTQSSESVEQLASIQLAAYHEAAHAVVGLRCGFGLGEVMLRRSDGGAEGHAVVANPFAGVWEGGARKPVMERRAIGLLAGWLAERLITRRASEKRLDEDHRAVLQLIADYGGPSGARRFGDEAHWGYLQRLRVKSLATLARHAWAVLHLGDELLGRLGRRRSVTILGKHVTAIVEPYLEPFRSDPRRRGNFPADAERYEQAHGDWERSPGAQLLRSSVQVLRQPPRGALISFVSVDSPLI